MPTFARSVEIAADLAQLLSSPWAWLLVVLVVLVRGKALQAQSAGVQGRPSGLSLTNLPRSWLIGAAVAAAVLFAFDVANQFGFKDWLIEKLPLTEVRNQTFRNQEVIVDGNYYSESTFDSVTFVVNGGPFKFANNNTFVGEFHVKSEKAHIQRVLSSADAAHLFKVPLTGQGHQLIPVKGKHFLNETVVIDGHAYYDCIFDGVEIDYHGGPYYIDAASNKFTGLGHLALDTDQQRVLIILLLTHTVEISPTASLPRPQIPLSRPPDESN